MDYAYNEVVNLLLRTEQMNKDLNSAKLMFDTVKLSMEKPIDVNVKVKELEIDLNKMMKEQIAAQERTNKLLIKEQEKTNRSLLNLHRQLASNKAKEEEKDERERDKANKAANKRRQDDKKAAAAKEHEVDVELHRYRMEGDAIAHKARMAQLRSEAAGARDAARFSAIMTPGGRPLALNPTSTPAASNINASAGLRAAAGAAGAIGQYPAAGALYATANALQLIGASSMSAASAAMYLGGALGIVGGAIVTYKFVAWGAEFSRELAKMSTLMSDASVSNEEFAATLDKTADAALRISSAFNIDAIEVVRAFKEAFSSGIDPADIERFVTLSATFATAVGSDLIGSITLLTSVKDSYRLSIREMAEASDVLFNAIDVGRVNVNELNKNFGRLSGVAAAAGVELNEVAAFVATLTRQGMTTANAITSVIQTINGLQNPSEKAKKALDAAGIATGDLAFRGRHLIDVFNELKTATGGAGDVIGTMFDEERARRGVVGAIRGINLYKNEVIPTINAVGTASVASSRALDNLADNFGKRITEISNEITARSAKTGGWISQLMFGSSGDAQASNKALVDRISALKELAKKELEGGNANAGNVAGKLAGDKPTSALTNLTGIDFFTDKNSAAFKEYTTKLAEATAATESAFADVKDAAVEASREIDEAMQTTTASNMKLIESLAKSMELTQLSKVENKEINDRATDSQKQLIDDLTLELEARKESLALKEQEARIDIQKKTESFIAMNVTPVEDQMSRAIAENNTSVIKYLQPKLDLAKEQVEAFAYSLETGMKNAGIFTPLVLEINELILRIETLRATALTEQSSAARGFEERLRKEYDEIRSENAKKKETDKADTIKDFNTIAEQLYQSDLRNYEKVQKKKLAAHTEATNEMDKQSKKHLALQAQIMNNILEAQADQRSDDPAAQARLGRNRRDEIKKQLDLVIEKKGSRDEFDSLAKQYQDASDLARSGTINNGDRSRGNRNYMEDQAVLGGMSSTFEQMARDQAAVNYQRNITNAGSANIRSPQEIARAAAEVQAAKTEVTKVVLDADIHLDIDGSLSTESEDRLAAKVIKAVQKMWANKNGGSNYDRSRRDTPTLEPVE